MGTKALGGDHPMPAGPADLLQLVSFLASNISERVRKAAETARSITVAVAGGVPGGWVWAGGAPRSAAAATAVP